MKAKADRQDYQDLPRCYLNVIIDRKKDNNLHFFLKLKIIFASPFFY